MQGASFIWAPQYEQGIAYFTSSFTVVPSPPAWLVAPIALVVSMRRRR